MLNRIESRCNNNICIRVELKHKNITVKLKMYSEKSYEFLNLIRKKEHHYLVSINCCNVYYWVYIIVALYILGHTVYINIYIHISIYTHIHIHRYTYKLHKKIKGTHIRDSTPGLPHELHFVHSV